MQQHVLMRRNENERVGIGVKTRNSINEVEELGIYQDDKDKKDRQIDIGRMGNLHVSLCKWRIIRTVEHRAVR